MVAFENELKWFELNCCTTELRLRKEIKSIDPDHIKFYNLFKSASLSDIIPRQPYSDTSPWPCC